MYRLELGGIQGAHQVDGILEEVGTLSSLEKVVIYLLLGVPLLPLLSVYITLGGGGVNMAGVFLSLEEAVGGPQGCLLA